MNGLGRTRPQKTAMLIARRIVDDIRRAGMEVGDRLSPEKVMLEEFKIGRGTLREALRFLELQGIISLKPGPGGGPTVERPDATNLATNLILLLQFENATFSSIVQARSDLEPIMARLAAKHISAFHRQELVESVKQMEESINDREIFLKSNESFHTIISWASGNSLYGFLIDALIGIVDGTSLGVDYPDHRRVAILRAHTKILECILAGDENNSQETMSAHMHEYDRYLEKKYTEVLSERITWNLI